MRFKGYRDDCRRAVPCWMLDLFTCGQKQRQTRKAVGLLHPTIFVETAKSLYDLSIKPMAHMLFLQELCKELPRRLYLHGASSPSSCSCQSQTQKQALKSDETMVKLACQEAVLIS